MSTVTLVRKLRGKQDVVGIYNEEPIEVAEAFVRKHLKHQDELITGRLTEEARNYVLNTYAFEDMPLLDPNTLE